MGGGQQALGVCAQNLGEQNLMVSAYAPCHALKAGCTSPSCALGHGPAMLYTRSVNPGA